MASYTVATDNHYRTCTHMNTGNTAYNMKTFDTFQLDSQNFSLQD